MENIYLIYFIQKQSQLKHNMKTNMQPIWIQSHCSIQQKKRCYTLHVDVLRGISSSTLISRLLYTFICYYLNNKYMIDNIHLDTYKKGCLIKFYVNNILKEIIISMASPFRLSIQPISIQPISLILLMQGIRAQNGHQLLEITLLPPFKSCT